MLDQKEYSLTVKQNAKVIEYLKACQSSKGGFSGSPYMEPHIASTYAAVCTLINIGTEQALSIINIKGILDFLLKIKHNECTQSDLPLTCMRTTWPGSFEIHKNGENDMRAIYCALVIADLLQLLNQHKELTKGVTEYITQCQTYEGGIACVPFSEAHAGYTYCGLASLLLLGEATKLDLFKLAQWTSNRQTGEGGFNGRIGKLVDSCYNFWVGAISELIDIALKGKGNYKEEWLVDQYAVQGYTLLCCQEKTGGMRDKPQRNADLYHTCYSLAGMSIMQSKSLYKELYEEEKFKAKNKGQHQIYLANEQRNSLKRVHPVYCLQHEKVKAAKKYFNNLLSE